MKGLGNYLVGGNMFEGIMPLCLPTFNVETHDALLFLMEPPT